MSPRTLYPEWRSVNAARKYPFADDATLAAITGETWPQGALLDARVYPVGGGSDQYISSVTLEGTQTTINISDSIRLLCRGTFESSSPPETLALYDERGTPAGVLVTDPQQMLLISSWGVGRTVVFPLAATRLAAAAVVPMPQTGVRGFVVNDMLFSGDVIFVAGAGVVFREEPGAVRIDVVGDAFSTRRKCQELDLQFSERTCFKTLNGLEPDERGNITVLPGTLNEDSVLRIEPIANGVELYLAGGR